MNFKLFGIIFVTLFLCGTVFAENQPDINFIYPSGQELTPTTITLDFNVADYNGDGVLRPVAPQLKLYYSTTPGTFQNLIVWDTNLSNNTGIVCADVNFFETTNCDYNWTIPSSIAAHTYYIDYNLMDHNTSSASPGYAYQPWTGYSDSFIVQLLPSGSATTGCGLIAWIAPLFGMLLAFFVIMQLMAGKFSPALVTLSIAGIIGIVIVWGFSSAICVI